MSEGVGEVDCVLDRRDFALRCFDFAFNLIRLEGTVRHGNCVCTAVPSSRSIVCCSTVASGCDLLSSLESEDSVLVTTGFSSVASLL